MLKHKNQNTKFRNLNQNKAYEKNWEAQKRKRLKKAHQPKKTDLNNLKSSKKVESNQLGI